MAERTLFLEKLKGAASKKKENEDQHDSTNSEPEGLFSTNFIYLQFFSI